MNIINIYLYDLRCHPNIFKLGNNYSYPKKTKTLPINENINADQVMLIGMNGDKLGLVSFKALESAKLHLRFSSYSTIQTNSKIIRLWKTLV